MYLALVRLRWVVWDGAMLSYHIDRARRGGSAVHEMSDAYLWPLELTAALPVEAHYNKKKNDCACLRDVFIPAACRDHSVSVSASIYGKPNGDGAGTRLVVPSQHAV